MKISSIAMGISRPSAAVARSRTRWKLYAFEIKRRPGKVHVGLPVRSRRVLVCAPDPAAALAGAGVSKDETCRAVVVRAHERIAPVLRRQSHEDTGDFYETVGHALMTGSGMGLALNMAARVARTPRMRGTIGALSDAIVHGEDLHVAMRRFPSVFTPMQLAMVEAAASTGLDKAGGLLVTLSERLHRDGKMWRTFFGALAYPVSLLALTVVGAIVLEVWALPPMVELFHTLGGRLPPLTQAFYAVAQFIRSHAVFLAPGVALLLALVAMAVPAIRRGRTAQTIAARSPIIGPIVQSMALIRALGTFILLKQSGAKVRDQFALAGAAAGNCIVTDFFAACYDRIVLGESVEEAFTAERHRLGDDGVRIAGRMEIGMAGADLGVLVDRIVDELNDRAENRLRLLPNMVRWPLLIVCCAIIGVVALAIVLPYPNLIADVAHQQTEAGLPR